jgi:hypothetical protein
MWGYTKFAWYLVRSVLVVWLVSMAVPCAAQDVEPPALDDTGRGSLFVPGGFLGVVAPVHERVSLNLYGFYYGRVEVPVAQMDVAIRATRFLTITPSYLYYEVPPGGLDLASQRPVGFTDTFEENQFRIDATAKCAVRRLEISSRSMFVRRFRPADDMNRFRQRIGIALPVSVNGRIWKPFTTYEAFYERDNSGWNRDRVIAGVTLPLAKRVSFQPSYIWENNRVRGLRDINYLQFGLIVNTR